jgi:hypothetical protein
MCEYEKRFFLSSSLHHSDTFLITFRFHFSNHSQTLFHYTITITMSTKDNASASTSRGKQPLQDITNTCEAMSVKQSSSTSAPVSPVSRPATPVAKQVVFREEDSEETEPYSRESYKSVLFHQWNKALRTLSTINRRRQAKDLSRESREEYEAQYAMEYERERRYFCEMQRLDAPSHEPDMKALHTAWETYASSLRSVQDSLQESLKAGWQAYQQTLTALTQGRQ